MLVDDVGMSERGLQQHMGQTLYCMCFKPWYFTGQGDEQGCPRCGHVGARALPQPPTAGAGRDDGWTGTQADDGQVLSAELQSC